MVRNRLHLQGTVKETPESSVASGTSTPTLDGHTTPTGTVYTDDMSTDDNAYDSDFVVVRNAEDQFSGFGNDEHIVRSLTEYTGEAEQSSASQSGPILGQKPLRDMHRYIRFEMLLVFILSTGTMALWITWFGQGTFKGHQGNDIIPAYTTSFITTITKTVHVPTVKTVSSVDTRTHTVTTTRISTTTVSATKAGNKPKLTGKAGSFGEGTLTRWDRGSNSMVQCYHGTAPTRYYNFLSRRKKLQRQEALWGCLDNSKNGMRWKGVKCGGARWEVEIDPNSGGIYSDSKKCWRRCEKCLSGAIREILDEAECVVEDRGSQCVARYTEL